MLPEPSQVGTTLEGPSADAVAEGAANTVTSSTGAHSSSYDPSEAPVGGGASAGSMTSAGTDPAGGSSTLTTREGAVLPRTPECCEMTVTI